MSDQFHPHPDRRRLIAAFPALLFVAACGGGRGRGGGTLDPADVSRAVTRATEMRAAGQRVWCVPFARNASGIQIRGDAHTWWDQARGSYRRGRRPGVGSIICFSDGGKLPLGHIAVVSDIVSKREIRVHHANWHRNKVSLDMPVKDVSRRGNWSEVKVMTNPGAWGATYRVDGFISHK